MTPLHTLARGRLFVLVLVLALGACTTDVTERRAIPRETLSVAGLEVRFAHDASAAAPFEAKIALEGAVRQRLRPPRSDGRPVDLYVTIDRAFFATQAQRNAVGVFAGSDVLDVTVSLLDKVTRETVAEFVVTGAYNPGGAGAYRDPIQEAANQVADAMARRMGGALMVQPLPPGS